MNAVGVINDKEVVRQEFRRDKGQVFLDSTSIKHHR